jgi:hypothetical protein
MFSFPAKHNQQSNDRSRTSFLPPFCGLEDDSPQYPSLEPSSNLHSAHSRSGQWHSMGWGMEDNTQRRSTLDSMSSVCLESDSSRPLFLSCPNEPLPLLPPSEHPALGPFSGHQHQWSSNGIFTQPEELLYHRNYDEPRSTRPNTTSLYPHRSQQADWQGYRY